MSPCCRITNLCQRRSERILNMTKEAIKNNNHSAFRTILSRHRTYISQHISDILQTIVRNVSILNYLIF